jgi:serine/threonine-protein kinase
LSRLVKEAVVTAKFSHPNIVAIYDVQEGDDSAFLAMEFVDGMSLDPFVWSKRRLDSGQAIALGVELARGLAAAHEHGLVHRDIKPANILLGKNGSIKITDFGIAELLTSMAPSQDVVFGTPGYLPPEALQGKGHNQASDLFALGAVLYFCITGCRPFEGKTIKEVIRKTLFGSARPASELAPETPEQFVALLASLLDKNPLRRPASASEVVERLEELARAHGARWNPPRDLTPSAPKVKTDEAGFLPTIRLSGKDRRAS